MTAGFELPSTGYVGVFDYLTLLLGRTTLPQAAGASGDISVPGFVSGKPFFLMSHGSASINNDLPVVTISGTNLHWDTGDFGSTVPPILYYGTWGVHRSDYAAPYNFGVQAFNADGYLQFDMASIPFVLWDKQTKAYGDGTSIGGGTQARLYTVTTTCPNPVAAFSGDIAVLNSIVDNGDGTWHVSFLGSDTDTAASITCYLFSDKRGSTPAAPPGFQLFEPGTGLLLFDHGMQPLRIYSDHALTDVTQTLIPPGSMPSGKSLAVVQCRPFTRISYIMNPGASPGDVGTARKYVTASQTSDGVSIAPIRRGDIMPPVESTHDEDSNGYALVIDVTGY